MTCRACGTQIPAGAGFCPSCGQAMSSSFCQGCGSPVLAGAAHCGRCGRVVSTTATPVASTGPGSNDQTSKGLVWVLGGAAGALAIVAVVVLVLVVNGGGSGDDGRELATAGSSSTVTTAAPTTATTAAPTTTTLDPISQARQQHPKLYEVSLRLENILTQSSDGREGVGEAVGGVRECTMDPYEAERSIDDVIFNRSTVLNQVAAVDVTGDPEAASLVEKLQRAIQHSIDADRHYNNWISYLYTDYYYTRPVGCPSGRAPQNSEYDEGTADSGRATTAKQDFVAMYNPIAESFGMRMWDYTEI